MLSKCFRGRIGDGMKGGWRREFLGGFRWFSRVRKGQNLGVEKSAAEMMDEKIRFDEDLSRFRKRAMDLKVEDVPLPTPRTSVKGWFKDLTIKNALQNLLYIIIAMITARYVAKYCLERNK